MPKIHVVSDLHLEVSDYVDMPGGDILIMAGDIMTAPPMRHNKTDAWSRKLAKRYTRFCEEELCKYATVLYVFGNHEPYGDDIDEHSNVIKDFVSARTSNVIFMNNMKTKIAGVTFLGTPLWASYGANHPDRECFIRNSMNDFVRITKKKINFSPKDANDIHMEAIKWLKKEIAKTPSECVVISHHAPSVLSKDENTKNNYGFDLDDAFYSDQNNFIADNQNIVIWIHGHTHHSCRYKIGNTLIVSNQRGYGGIEANSKHFDPLGAVFDTKDILDRKI